ncbi:MAG: hypothetical protein GQ574_11065 [Crocinitomix sp.]|nr:hypothetical protein [Crocinitomix sp.]
MNLTIGNSKEVREEKLPNLEGLKKCLNGLKENKVDCYLIIDNKENDYLQCAGANDKFTVELRTPKNDTFGHWRLGQLKQSKVWEEIDCHVGPISVLQHEVFSFETICSILTFYFEKSKMMEETEEGLRKMYIFRNITKMFD